MRLQIRFLFFRAKQFFFQKEIVESKHFFSDQTIILRVRPDLIEKIVSNPKYKDNIIFDGYPSNLEQAKNLGVLLEKYKQKIDLVISLKVTLDSIVKRITGRLVCSKCGNTFNTFFNPPPSNSACCEGGTLKQRSDDNVETAKKRYQTYEDSTKPILKYYNKSGLLKEVDGETKIEEIFNKINAFVN